MISKSLDLDSEGDLPRLYTLSNPFDELKVVVEGRVRNDRLVSAETPIEANMTILYNCTDPHPYPFIVMMDRQTSEIIFYKRSTVRSPTTILAAISSRTDRAKHASGGYPKTGHTLHRFGWSGARETKYAPYEPRLFPLLVRLLSGIESLQLDRA